MINLQVFRFWLPFASWLLVYHESRQKAVANIIAIVSNKLSSQQIQRLAHQWWVGSVAH